MSPPAARLARAARLAPYATRLALRPTAARRMPQDLPPEGGYDPVQYKVRMHARDSKDHAQRTALTRRADAAQLTGQGFTACVVYCRRGPRHDIRLVQAGRGHRGVEVRFLCSVRRGKGNADGK